MPRLSPTQLPSYRLHKPSGQAVVTIDKRDHYLGAYDSVASRAKYDRIIGEWVAGGRHLPAEAGRDTTVVEIIAAFSAFAQRHYRHPDGTATGEWPNFALVLKQLRLMYGDTPAAEFGPLKLKALRNRLLAEHEVDEGGKRMPGWSRTVTNRAILRVRQVFRWAVGEELIPASVYDALRAVDGLRAGRTDARETEPVRPVDEAHVRAIFPFVSRQVRAMLELQLITAARGGELFGMTAAAIDRSRPDVWVYRPVAHKTAFHGHAREIRLGRKAQAIVAPFLRDRAPDVPLFSPVEAERERREKMHRRRVEQKTTPLSCGNRPGTNRKARPKRQPHATYNKDSYQRAVTRAIVRANVILRGGWVCGNEDVIVPHWHVHQIRHTAATKLRQQFGLEAAQVLLGHATLKVTQLYAEKNVALADRVVADAG